MRVKKSVKRSISKGNNRFDQNESANKYFILI